MTEVLYFGLHEGTLDILRDKMQNVNFISIAEGDIVTNAASLGNKGVLLIGEKASHPVRVAQEAFSKDKNVSILLINDKANQQKVKQSLQFAPFVGPTIQAISNDTGPGLAAIVEDAMQRTEQRRSYARIKSASSSIPAFSPNHMEKVRVSYMTRVLDEAPIGAALLGKDGVVLNVNNYIVRLLQLTDKDILGVPFSDHFAGKEQGELLDFINDGFHSRHKRIFELAQGEEVKFLEISIGNIDSTSPSPYKIAIVNDVTDTAMAQKRTMAHVEELQKLNEELIRVNEDLDTFVYTASHDLKSPILNIEGLVNLLEEGLGAEQIAELPELEHIRLSIERFKGTIEDLTEVARIQRTFAQEASHLDVVSMTEDVLQLLKSEIQESGAVVETDFGKAPTVVFYKKNFKSILLNLVSNAIKYRSPERQAHINIHTTAEDGFFKLTVQDNGLGLPAGKQDKIFRLFKRMHMHVKGSGVGLYIVKRIVSNVGGTVHVESKENEGTMFQIAVPLRTELS